MKVRSNVVSMTISKVKSEILSGPERRRRWGPLEKVAMVVETHEPEMTVSLVAQWHGVAPNQLFTWRRLAAQGVLTVAGAEEAVVPASNYCALQAQLREVQRLLGKRWRRKSSRRLWKLPLKKAAVACSRPISAMADSGDLRSARRGEVKYRGQLPGSYHRA
jgi:transposase